MQINIRFALELYKVCTFHFPVGHLLNDSCSESPCRGVWVTRLCFCGVPTGSHTDHGGCRSIEGFLLCGVFRSIAREKNRLQYWLYPVYVAKLLNISPCFAQKTVLIVFKEISYILEYLCIRDLNVLRVFCKIHIFFSPFHTQLFLSLLHYVILYWFEMKIPNTLEFNQK